MNGNSRRVRRSSVAAPSRSCPLPGCTTRPSIRPSVSTRMCRLRPVSFLPASKPCGSIDAPLFCAALALWLSMMAALGLASRPARSRTRHVELMMDASQGAVPFPQVEVVVHRALRRQVLGQRGPLAAGRQHVEDAVQDFADIDCPLTPTVLRRWDQRLDQRPFGVGQITRIAKPATVGGRAVFRLPHRAPQSSWTGDRQ